MNLRTFSIVAAAVAGLGLAPALAQDGAPPFKMDLSHTQIMFKISHLGFSQTYGSFDKFESSINFDPAKPAETAVEVTIDAASVDAGWEARDKHLRSADFFNVEEFPTITFKSTSVEVVDDETAKLMGDLTLLGVTKPIVLDVKLNGKAPHPFAKDSTVAGFAATGMIKRSEFGMVTGLPGIGDDVTLIVQTEINNRPPRN